MDIERIKHITKNRIFCDDIPIINIKITHHPSISNTKFQHFECPFILDWLSLYECYRARPVWNFNGKLFMANLTIDPAWCRALKHYFRTRFGISHVHNVNQKDNRERVEKFLGGITTIN